MSEKGASVSSEEITAEAAACPTGPAIKAQLVQELQTLMVWVESCQTLTFFDFETQLGPKVLALGVLLVQLFLVLRHERFEAQHPQATPGYKRQGPFGRELGTCFGQVRYARTYFYQAGHGYYPLDNELGLTRDGFSMRVRSYASRLATKVSYAQAALILSGFLGWAPAQDSLEEMVLGLGQHTAAWFANAPAPTGDGEVLIIQIDSKATPTATEAELKKRRGPRPPNSHPGSQRHRGRAARQRRGSQKRRQKGDKAKNGKMATIVTRYTLRRSADGQLEGPLNKKGYASYAPKRHAVAIARREADKRGFRPTSGQLIQLVTDGDADLAFYIAELFPEAIHTLDVYHVTEYLWEAGGCLYAEGSLELTAWVEVQKDLLYKGRAAKIVAELDQRLAHWPRGKRAARTRWQQIRDYLHKRVNMMKYHWLRKQDLEISSGAVEGAVNYVIARRFDCGGMRWIKERAEHLLQLRCIEVNEDWDAFIQFVHDRTQAQAQQQRTNLSLKCTQPAPLPSYGLVQ